jgi:hypothetical protein
MKHSAYSPKTRCEKAIFYSGYAGSALGTIGYVLMDQLYVKNHPTYSKMGIPTRIALCASFLFGGYYLSTNAAFYLCPYRSDITPPTRDSVVPKIGAPALSGSKH